MTLPSGKPTWDKWYAKRAPSRMGLVSTYRKAVAWVDQPGYTVQDWGGGAGEAKQYFQQADYKLVDGSWRGADVLTDLCTYRTSVDAILMRHVLEHNHRWADILDNAVASFRQRMALVLYFPFEATTHDIGTPGRVAEYVFAKTDIMDRMRWLNVEVETVKRETVLYVSR